MSQAIPMMLEKQENKSSTVGTQIRVPRAMGMGVEADHEEIFLGLWGHVTQYKLLRSSKLSQHPMT